jgi:hypothetical protein
MYYIGLDVHKRTISKVAQMVIAPQMREAVAV